MRYETPMAWLHLDQTHIRAANVLSAVDGMNRAVLPNNVLSVNRRRDNAQALVKVSADPATIIARLPTNQQSVVLRVFDESTHAEALALVRTVDWLPPAEAT